MLADCWTASVLWGNRGTPWIGLTVIALMGGMACSSQEVVDADGVSREDSSAAVRRLQRQSLELNEVNECVVQAGAPNVVGGCPSFPVPIVSPATPWLLHNESHFDWPVQTLPITVEFAREVRGVRLEGWGPIKCAGDPGRVTAFRQGAQVFSAPNSIFSPEDCPPDDVTGLVVNVLAPDLAVDRLVIDGISPWSWNFDGFVGHFYLNYGVFWTREQPLTCTPIVERGQQVTCTASLPASTTVTGWEFVPDSVHFLDVQETSTSKEWWGIAATGGVVKAHVTDGTTGRADTLETRFTVTNRRSQWRNNWDYRPGQSILDGEVTSSTAYVGINCPQQFPDPLHCFLNSPDWVQPDPGLEPGYTPTEIPSGPNQSYWLPTDIRYNMKRAGSVHPGILPTSTYKHPVAREMLSKTCKAGLGVKNGTSAVANMNQATQYCGLPGFPGYDMNAFVAGVWAHEGYGSNGGVGHQKLAEDAAGLEDATGRPVNDPYMAIEELVFPDSTGLAEAVELLVSGIADFIHWWQSDTNSVNRGPHGSWAPTPGHYMYFWEPQPGGTSKWAPYILNDGS
jgi:hypothetical protein